MSVETASEAPPVFDPLAIIGELKPRDVKHIGALDVLHLQLAYGPPEAKAQALSRLHENLDIEASTLREDIAGFLRGDPESLEAEDIIEARGENNEIIFVAPSEAISGEPEDIAAKEWGSFARPSFLAAYRRYSSLLSLAGSHDPAFARQHVHEIANTAFETYDPDTFLHAVPVVDIHSAAGKDYLKNTRILVDLIGNDLATHSDDPIILEEFMESPLVEDYGTDYLRLSLTSATVQLEEASMPEEAEQLRATMAEAVGRLATGEMMYGRKLEHIATRTPYAVEFIAAGDPEPVAIRLNAARILTRLSTTQELTEEQQQTLETARAALNQAGLYECLNYLDESISCGKQPTTAEVERLRALMLSDKKHPLLKGAISVLTQIGQPEHLTDILEYPANLTDAEDYQRIVQQLGRHGRSNDARRVIWHQHGIPQEDTDNRREHQGTVAGNFVALYGETGEETLLQDAIEYYQEHFGINPLESKASYSVESRRFALAHIIAGHKQNNTDLIKKTMDHLIDENIQNNLPALYNVYSGLATACLDAGLLEQAEAYAAEVARLTRSANSSWYQQHSLPLYEAYAGRGDHANARRIAEKYILAKKPYELESLGVLASLALTEHQAASADS